MPSLKNFAWWGFLITIAVLVLSVVAFVLLSILFGLLALVVDPLIVGVVSLLVSLPLSFIIVGYVAYKIVKK